MKTKKYYTLTGVYNPSDDDSFPHHGLFNYGDEIIFGDFERDCVEYEKDSLRDSGYKKLKIHVTEGCEAATIKNLVPLPKEVTAADGFKFGYDEKAKLWCEGGKDCGGMAFTDADIRKLSR
tara:strand:- start:85 stop:447 length:363 start_codon:yes stop_codon:yes gene_type:complete